MKISYNWLKWYIEGTSPEPEKLADILTFKLCEVEGIEKLPDGDTIFDLNILPNRAHDLLSHQGVAREVAGILGCSFKDPTELYKIPESKPTNLKIEIETSACRRYMGRVVRNIKVGPSPDWVVKHLESIGQRSINNMVDATNIVMFDCGQPCHAFDLKQIESKLQVESEKLKVVIANAKEGEKFAVLGRDQLVVTLKETDMVIADGQGNTLAIAGVKGGLSSGANDETKGIILEVANFDAVSVRKTARRLGLLSDSAKRFENNLSPEHTSFAMRELSGLILEMCPDAIFEDVVDVRPTESFGQVYPNPQEKRTIPFTTSRINTYLGTTIPEEEMVTLLKNYGFRITGENDIYALEVPALRLDLEGMHDIAEEVLRLYGLEKITPILPVFPNKPRVHATQYLVFAVQKFFTDEHAIRSHADILPGRYSEVMTYSFRKKGVFEVANGVGDKGALRTNLGDGLKESFELNRLQAPLLGLDEIKIFEIGTVFPKEGEIIHVGWADKKGVHEMELEAFCREQHISVTDSYEAVLDTRANTDIQKFVPWSQYPFIVRDIALWVPEGTTSLEVLKVIQENAGELSLGEPRLFDTFTKPASPDASQGGPASPDASQGGPASPAGGDGKTSYAFRLVFQSYDHTLTEEEVIPFMEDITKVIHKKGWEIR